MRPHFVSSTDGVRIAVHPLNDAPEGAPVLLVCHALGFCAPMYAPLARHLGSRVRCLGIDLRFHGASSAPEHPTFAWREFGDDVLAVLDSDLVAKDAPVHGFGHSLGGAAVTLAAARAKGRIRSIYLYEPVIAPPEFFARAGGSNPMADMTEKRRARFESRDDAKRNFLAKPPFSTFDPGVLAAYVDGALEDEAEGGVSLRCRPSWEAMLYRTAGESGAWDRAPDVSARVRVAMGGGENEGPGAFAARVAARLGAASPTRYADLRHFGPFESPATIAREVAAFLADSSDARG